MSSVAISGKPGGGKSYYATLRALEELETSSRAIVTNVDLILENIVRYCVNKGREDIDVYGRVQLIDYDHVKEFWRFRGPEVDPLPALTDEAIARGERPDLQAAAGSGAVLYILDELHEHLNSRQWKSTGPAVLYYIAKHRHLGDDVLWLTQSIPNVDKQWRSVTQEYLYCRNLRKEMWRGFSRGGGFMVQSYLEPFTGLQQPQWKKEYKLDKSVAACYRTSTVGAKADTGEKRKGIPLWLLFGGIGLFFAVLACLSIWGPSLFAKSVSKTTTGALPSSAPARSVLPPPVASPPALPQAAAFSPPEPDVLLAVPVDHLSARDIFEQIKPTLGAVKCWVSPGADALIFSGPFQQVALYSEAVKRMDAVRHQVVVSAVIVRESDGRLRQFGLGALFERAATGAGPLGQWAADAVFTEAIGLAGGFISFGSVYGARAFLDGLAANRATDDGMTVIGRPEVTVLSGEVAELTAGREIPVPVTVRDSSGSTSSIDYRKADFSFRVLPVVQGADLFVQIDQRNTEVLDRVQVGGDTVPALSTQSLSTKLRVRENEVLVMGGVEQDVQSTVRRGVPILRDVPLVSFLFSEKKTEIRRESVWVFVYFSIVPHSVYTLEDEAFINQG